MSVYTDARSTPGLATGGSDDRALFMKNFNSILQEAWEESFDFQDQTYVRYITAGKSDTFPIIGRKRDAVDHVPGEIILGGKISHGEIEITLDNIMVDSVFIAEIDELLAHYPLAEPYARQLGQSLASASNTKIGRSLILASRQTAIHPDHVTPSYYYNSSVASDASKLEEAAFKGVEYIRKNDIGGGQPTYWLPHQQQLLLARYTGIDTVDTSGSGNRAAGTVGQIAGLNIRGTNSIPNTNVTTGLTKYQGDFSTTVGVIANKMAVATLRRRGIRTVIKDQEDRLGTLIIASKFEGHGPLRGECSFEVASASR